MVFKDSGSQSSIGAACSSDSEIHLVIKGAVSGDVASKVFEACHLIQRLLSNAELDGCFRVAGIIFKKLCFLYIDAQA